MKENVLKFKNDIKALVAKQKETGDAGKWMHPIYCAYFMLKHNVENKEEFIENEIKKSYKALCWDGIKDMFRNKVNSIYKEYAEVVCTD